MPTKLRQIRYQLEEAKDGFSSMKKRVLSLSRVTEETLDEAAQVLVSNLDDFQCDKYGHATERFSFEDVKEMLLDPAALRCMGGLTLGQCYCAWAWFVMSDGVFSSVEGQAHKNELDHDPYRVGFSIGADAGRALCEAELFSPALFRLPERIED
jgi:hypothetical protein